MKRIKTTRFEYSTETGLNDAQASEMRELFGRNVLTPPKRAPWWRELLAKFDDATIRILLAAAAISLAVTAVERFALGNGEASFADSIGVFLAVALATLVGFFSERKSSKEFDALNEIKEDIPIKVVRDGRVETIGVADVVVGDVVKLDPGDKVPADGVLVDAANLRIDQAMLTGESVPVRKVPLGGAGATVGTGGGTVDLDKAIESARPGNDSFVARGTNVADGRGVFVATAVGDRSEMGKIADALAANDLGDSETPLVQKLARLAKQISVVGVASASAIFTAMAVAAVLGSPLTKALANEPGTAAVLGVVALVVGILGTRFVAKPFFASMGTPIGSKRVAALAALPTVAATATILLGIWGLTLGGETSAALAKFVENAGNAGGAASAASAGALLGIALLKEALTAFVVAVTIVVVAVPEGLPMMVTVSLALNTMKMARENCLVRRLVASETIGSATTICTDKTGTLTENRMTPTRVVAEGEVFDAKRFDELTKKPVWTRLVRNIAVNGSADLNVEPATDGDAETVVGVGNPTECSLLKFLRSRGVDYRAERAAVPTRLFELGHNSRRKASIAAFETADGEPICCVKGAPERILASCSTAFVDGGEVPFDGELRTEVERRLKESADDALRTIAFAERTCAPGSAPKGCPACVGSEPIDSARSTDSGAETDALADAETVCANCSNRRFLGLIGISDPVRPEAAEAVRRCREAGIRVKTITGDALPTAIAVSREVGVYSGAPDELALTSDEFAQISDADLPDVAEKIVVLARSTPADKLRLVQALHRKGEVVAMTGDGTNDAPALKAADVGLSMGITGTEVAKEASDVVLVDDNFASVVTGVWWGRTLFQNIRRFLQFQLSVNVVALLAALLGPAVGVPLPLTVTQLLWINIIMDTFAAIALSTDPPRPHTLTEKPIPRDAGIVTPSMGVSILFCGLYQVAILFAALFCGWFVEPERAYDGSIPFTSPRYLEHNIESLTIFFTVLVMFQFWHKFNCRALRWDESPFERIGKNKTFLTIVFSITAAQIALVQIPAIGAFFRTTPLSLAQWVEITLLTATILPVAWVGRRFSRALGFEK